MITRATRWAVGVLVLAAGGLFAPLLAANAGYTPTMQDMMSIQAALHRYHAGLDQRDNKLMASAFTADGTLTLIDHGKQMVILSHAQIAVGGLMSPEGDLWHFTEINSYFEFESPTRVRHSAYWMDVHPHEESHTSTLGIPGHYEDVLIKHNGEWLLLSRKVFVGT